MSESNNQNTSYSINGLERILNSAINFIFYYRLVVVVIAIVFLIISAVSISNSSTDNDKLKNISIVLACGSVVIGIFYSVINYEHSQIKFRHDIKASRNSLSFNAASEWFKPSMVENLKITKVLYVQHRHLIDENKAAEFSKILDENEQARSALVSIFNYLECIAIAVNENILDESFMKKYLSGVCVNYIIDYGFYIDYKRNVNKSAQIWINFTNLARKWQD